MTTTLNEEETCFVGKHLHGPQDWYPERLGPKRTIFERPGSRLFAMAVDPPPVAPNWKAPGNAYFESLISALNTTVRRDDLVLLLGMPDGAWMEMYGCQRLDPTQNRNGLLSKLLGLGPGSFGFFDEVSVPEAGPKMLVLLLHLRGAVVFELSDHLEIAYYGPEDLWNEIASALYGP